MSPTDSASYPAETPERRGEMALAREAAADSDHAYRQLGFAQQQLRSPDTFLDHVGIGCAAGRRLEAACKRVGWHSGNSRKILQRNVGLQMCVYVIPDAGKRPTADAGMWRSRRLNAIHRSHAEAGKGNQMLDIKGVGLVAECHLGAKRAHSALTTPSLLFTMIGKLLKHSDPGIPRSGSSHKAE